MKNTKLYETKLTQNQNNWLTALTNAYTTDYLLLILLISIN